VATSSASSREKKDEASKRRRPLFNWIRLQRLDILSRCYVLCSVAKKEYEAVLAPPNR